MAKPQLATENQRLVIIVLTTIAIVAVLGDIFLIALGREVPGTLINLAFSSGGAIGGILTGTSTTNNNTSSDKHHEAEDSLGTFAAKSIISDALKRMEEK